MELKNIKVDEKIYMEMKNIQIENRFKSMPVAVAFLIDNYDKKIKGITFKETMKESFNQYFLVRWIKAVTKFFKNKK